MIEGHGDDTYCYPGIASDFSSNICATASHHSLMAHLATHPELLAHYPEPEAWSLETMLAEHHGIDPRCVIVTNGATEAIYLIAQTFHYRPVIPAPTFSEYEDAYRDVGAAKLGSFAHCTAAKLGSFAHYGGNTVLWLCNPNNPDGKVYDQTFIDRMADEHELVVLDQSYEHYTDAPLLSPRQCCLSPCCLQIHSFTKTYGVPGLRLGYITAHESLTAQIRLHLRPWSVSALAIEAGKYLLQHDELTCKPDLKEAQRLRQQLLATGIDVVPTQTNFMLCRLPAADHASEREGLTAATLKDRLAQEHHILIRDASNFRCLTPQHFRVAAQTPVENDALVAALRLIIDKTSRTLT